MRRIASLVVVGLLAVGVFAVPAAGTVHEITGMFCSPSGGNPTPPGISKEGNFARPLEATGFIESVEPYAGDGVNGPGILVTFDFDHPASKLAAHPTIDTFFFGDGTYVTAFVLEGGFTNCKLLRD